MSVCQICGINSVRILLALGDQPICNRFLIDVTDKEYTHPMVIGQCQRCGLIQITEPIPAAELLPRYPWITYNEPQEHLDALAETILHLPGVTPDASICGISFKDDSTLTRLQRKGFTHTWRLKPKEDLDIIDPQAGVETIQAHLTVERVKMIAHRYGSANVVIVRHILEHAHTISFFLSALKHLVTPQGYLIIEVPDCTRAIEDFDYTTLWEEHIAFFTPLTFHQSLSNNGFSFVHFECYPYPFENSLIGILRLEGKVGSCACSSDNVGIEKNRAERYVQNFHSHRLRVKNFFTDYRLKKRKIAFFGAGHLCCTFINLFELKEVIEFIMDDNPHKQGLRMPGSRLSIYSSSALVEKDITLCLLSLSPQLEDKVIEKNSAFIAKGGEFLSIFPSSKYTLNRKL